LVLERLSGEHLHHDELLAIGVTNVMDGADVRMIQSRRGARFPAEAFERLRIVS
jgi:hypothetical protein